MKPNDVKDVPRCTIDYPLELTPDEVISLTAQINTLLKSTLLLGSPVELDTSLHSLFDIAEELCRVHCAAYVSDNGDRFELSIARHIPHPEPADSSFFSCVAIAKHFGKAVVLDPRRHPVFAPVCGRWKADSLTVFPLRRHRDFIGAIVFGKTGETPFSPVQVKLLWFLVMQAENHLLQGETLKALSFYSYLDPLTHLYNRRHFDLQLEKEILRSRRNGKPFSLLMIDLDGFKNYNDRFLHSSGDIALQEFGSILAGSIREVDTAARFGGDEFAVILVESGADGARDLADRLVERFRSHLLPGLENQRTERLSASVGIASFPADSFDPQDLVRKADRALYIAKDQGAGKICLIQDIGDLLTIKSTENDIPIQKIYSAARSVVDMDNFLEILLFTAMQGMSADRGSIVVVNPDGNCILRAAIGFSNGAERISLGATVPPGAVTAWVIEHREPLIVSGPQDSPFERPLKKNGYRTDSFFSVPLVHGDRVLGAIHLTNRRNRQAFSRDDLAAFQPIAGEIAALLSQGIEFRENIKSFSTSLLHSLSSTLELRFRFLSGHGRRVRDMAVRAGIRLDLPPLELECLGIASSLHDIGIVGIPESILLKKQRLSDRELDIARKHAFLGSKLLEGVPGLERARRIILEHHETYNGTGYPYGLRGEETSMGGRILAVAEFYDAIVSERPHRGKLRPEEALQLVKNGAGTRFDPAVARIFVEDPTITSPGNFSTPG